MKIKKIKIALILAIMFIGITAFSQNKGVSFKFVENNENYKTATFSIYGVNTDADVQVLKKTFAKDSNIKSFKIFYNRRCQIVYNKMIDADYIRMILQSEGAEYDKDYVIVHDKYTEQELYQAIKDNYADYNDRRKKIKGTWKFPVDYPEKNKNNKNNFSDIKAEWIEANPYKYKEITGKEYLDIANNSIIVK